VLQGSDIVFGQELGDVVGRVHGCIVPVEQPRTGCNFRSLPLFLRFCNTG
jgi:hypothetical protein